MIVLCMSVLYYKIYRFAKHIHGGSVVCLIQRCHYSLAHTLYSLAEYCKYGDRTEGSFSGAHGDP